MKPIGFDLEKIAAGGADRPSHGDCPGALLLVTRDEYDTMVRNGETFRTERRDMDSEGGRRDARVRCSGIVMRKQGVSGGMIYYGLCASCSEAERLMREQARDRAKGR